MHREHYVEQLRSVVASKAPAMVETAPTYVTPTSFDDALGVRHLPMAAARALLHTGPETLRS